jgi:hypothetical protein
MCICTFGERLPLGIKLDSPLGCIQMLPGMKSKEKWLHASVEWSLAAIKIRPIFEQSGLTSVCRRCQKVGKLSLVGV